MEYKDFDIKIEATQTADGAEYRVLVLATPAGEAGATLQFGMSDAEIRQRLHQLGAYLRPRLGLTPVEEQAVQAFGEWLFTTLFHIELRSLWDRSRDKCRDAGCGLRLKLRCGSPLLATLPWELLYDKRFDEYLALSGDLSVVRYVELARPADPIAVELPLHILGIVSDPKDLPRLDVAAEKKHIEQALTPLLARGLVQLSWLEQPNWRALMRQMRRGKWHIVHYVGHSAFDPQRNEGVVCFEDADGNVDRLSARKLGQLLRSHPSLQLVLLNSCEGGRLGEDIFSSSAATLVRQGIPTVIAMQYAVTDAAALEFSRTFYELLCENSPVERALAEARLAINFAVENRIEFATPVFYTHAPDSVLFSLPPKLTPAQPSANNAGWGGYRDAEELEHCLLAAYEYASLQRMLRYRLDKRLDQLVAQGSFREVVFALIALAEREGWVVELIRAAHEGNRSNRRLAAFAQRFNMGV